MKITVTHILGNEQISKELDTTERPTEAAAELLFGMTLLAEAMKYGEFAAVAVTPEGYTLVSGIAGQGDNRN